MAQAGTMKRLSCNPHHKTMHITHSSNTKQPSQPGSEMLRVCPSEVDTSVQEGKQHLEDRETNFAA